MPRKTNDVRRKGKDKAREHFDKCGKYDGKSVRRIEAYLEKVKPVTVWCPTFVRSLLLLSWSFFFFFYIFFFESSYIVVLKLNLTLKRYVDKNMKTIRVALIDPGGVGKSSMLRSSSVWPSVHSYGRQRIPCRVPRSPVRSDRVCRIRTLFNLLFIKLTGLWSNTYG